LPVPTIFTTVPAVFSFALLSFNPDALPRLMSRSTKFSFTPATDRDVPALATLHTSVAAHLTAQYGQGPWSGETTEKGVRFAMRMSKVFVARSGTEIVGALRLTTRKPWAIDTRHFSPSRKPLYLLAMAIAPAKQRRGLGTRCLKEAVKIAQAWPADAIRLDAFDAPAGAGGFYTKCGWTEMGRATYRGASLIYFELRL
jgi:GNAT superfamily N-acetyltransferase